jgi:hypothetical protein
MDPHPRSSVRSRVRSRAAQAFAAGLLALIAGCSSKKTTAPPPPPVVAGQFGTSCLPTDGEQNNPACDSTDGFACYGTSPTDASSFCTKFDCAADAECPAGWWCATVNKGPNVTSTKTTYGPTRPVCLPRAYCSPCSTDRDCPLTPDGVQQHCARDANGSGYCSVGCAGAANCPFDAVCQNWQSLCTPSGGSACVTDDDCSPSAQGIAQHCDARQCTPECGSDSDCPSGATCQWHQLCAPRAGTCLGNGGFCSPCRSDADCKNGYCLSGAPYSTERFCSVVSTVTPCDSTTLDPPGCPPHTASDHWAGIACTTDPPNQCEGLVVMGAATGAGGALPGCWTANR